MDWRFLATTRWAYSTGMLYFFSPLSVHNFKHLWSHWAHWSQIVYEASLGWGSVPLAERLVLLTSDDGVPGSNPAWGEILPKSKRRCIAQSTLTSSWYDWNTVEKEVKAPSHPSLGWGTKSCSNVFVLICLRVLQPLLRSYRAGQFA